MVLFNGHYFLYKSDASYLRLIIYITSWIDNRVHSFCMYDHGALFPPSASSLSPIADFHSFEVLDCVCMRMVTEIFWPKQNVLDDWTFNLGMWMYPWFKYVCCGCGEYFGVYLNDWPHLEWVVLCNRYTHVLGWRWCVFFLCVLFTKILLCRYMQF